MVQEHVQCTSVCWHCVVVEVAADDPPQPLPLLGDRLVHAPSQCLLNLPQLRLHAVSPGFPLNLEFAAGGASYRTRSGYPKKKWTPVSPALCRVANRREKSNMALHLWASELTVAAMTF
jgi:hypothetical protein